MEFIWSGEKERELALSRPCSCGCDERDGFKGVGYLTGSNEKGEGFTIWLEDEAVFQAVANSGKVKVMV